MSANVNKFVQIWHQLIDQIHCANRNRLKYAVKSKKNSAKTKGQHICSKMMDYRDALAYPVCLKPHSIQIDNYWMERGNKNLV